MAVWTTFDTVYKSRQLRKNIFWLILPILKWTWIIEIGLFLWSVSLIFSWTDSSFHSDVQYFMQVAL